VFSQTTEAGWSKSTTRTVTLVATDTVPSGVNATSGVKEISGSVNSGAPVTEPTATVTFTVAKGLGGVLVEGSNSVGYSARDWAGNIKNGTGYINVDTVNPATAITPALEPIAGINWRNTPLTVTLNWTDVSSGVPAGGTTYIIDSGSPLAYTGPFAVGTGTSNASIAVRYFSTDRAGNVEPTSTVGYVNIDTKEPTTTAAPVLASSPTAGWLRASQEVTLTATDNLSGVPVGGTTYRVDDGNLTIYGTPFVVTKEGSTKLTYRSTDRAQNLETLQTGYVNIDTTVPKVAASVAPTPNSYGWNKSPVTVSLVASDLPSGIAKTQYRLQTSTEWLDASGNEFQVSAEGKQSYYYRALDNAGNESVIGTVDVAVDTIDPKAFGDDASGTHGKNITLKYKFTDNVSPQAQAIYVKIKNSKGNVVKTQNISGLKNVKTWYSFTWKAGPKGTYKYYVHGKDLAGNASTTTAAKIVVR
jgi:hypothetical protein